MNLYLDVDFKTVFDKGAFFFGVANAPYLCEGGYNTPEGPKNSLGHLEADGIYPISGDTTSYWTTYEEHISLAASLGMTAYRTGVDWSRIQPTFALEEGPTPDWDHAAVAVYVDMLCSVQRAGMMPIVTLHHFTHPAWLGRVFWDRDDSAEVGAAFEVRVVEEINDGLVARGFQPLSSLITFNELNLLPWKVVVGKVDSLASAPVERFVTVYDNALHAHVLAYDGIRDLYQRRDWPLPEIGFGTYAQSPYEFDKLMIDIVRVRCAGVTRDAVPTFLNEQRTAWVERLDALARRQLSDNQYAFWRDEIAEVQQVIDGARFTRTLDAIYASPTAQKLDFISANIYEPFRNARAAGDPARKPLWWEFAADGDIYRTMIHAYNDGNVDLPMYMGENTLSYRQPLGEAAEPRPDGWNRERYLKTYLMEIVRCIAEGVPIRGYLYWSLVDDFEWDSGFTPRMGLYNYDYENRVILPTDGLGEPAGEIYAHLVRALQSGRKEVIRDAFVNAFDKSEVSNSVHPE